MARIIAVCNMKGGVGKTTTCTSVSSYLALYNRKTLLIDFDPQANATSGVGYNFRNAEKSSIYDALVGRRKVEELIRFTSIPGFHFIPSHPALAGLTIELLEKANREYFLRLTLEPLLDRYQYILIDLPPSVSLLTINGLMAAKEVIIPVQCEYYGLEGLGQLLETIDMINFNLGHNLRIAGALLTMYDNREHLSREVAKELRRHFIGHVYEVEVPRAVALAEAPSFGQPICFYEPFSPGARAYERLAKEIIQQENSKL